MKLLSKLAVLALLAAGFIFGWNYIALGHKVNAVIQSDPRDSGVAMRLHYDYYLNPTVLVVDMRGLAGEKSMADVFRVLMQLSHELRAQHFRSVKLECLGKEKYLLAWGDFLALGTGLDGQNPMYLARTFPEKLLRPDGAHAFGTWTGGLLGVLSKQLEDFNQFHRDWYMNDLLTSKE